MRHLKVLVGRLIRVFERNVVKSGIELSASDQDLLVKIKRVHAQSFLNKKPRLNTNKQATKFYTASRLKRLNVLEKASFINHMNLAIRLVLESVVGAILF